MPGDAGRNLGYPRDRQWLVQWHCRGWYQGYSCLRPEEVRMSWSRTVSQYEKKGAHGLTTTRLLKLLKKKHQKSWTHEKDWWMDWWIEIQWFFEFHSRFLTCVKSWAEHPWNPRFDWDDLHHCILNFSPATKLRLAIVFLLRVETRIRYIHNSIQRLLGTLHHLLKSLKQRVAESFQPVEFGPSFWKLDEPFVLQKDFGWSS